MFSGGVVDNIRKAGQNKVTIIIRYIDKKQNVTERETEPYEMKDGAYWGYDINKDTIKKFNITNILEATPTNNEFSPRYPVKF